MGKRKKLGDVPRMNGSGNEELREMIAGSEKKTKTIAVEPDWPGEERKGPWVVDADGKKTKTIAVEPDWPGEERKGPRVVDADAKERPPTAAKRSMKERVPVAAGTPAGAKPARKKAEAGRYLTFHLGSETFGVPILKVREILGIAEPTEVPLAPRYVRGVLNLRGSVLPVIDMRLKLGMPPVKDTPKSCIVVFDIEQESKHLRMGAVVDEVAEVLWLDENQIRETPEIGKGVDADVMLGVAQVGEGVALLLDVDRAVPASNGSRRVPAGD